MWRVFSTKMLGVESLAEFEWPGRPERTSLRRALRHRLRLEQPSLRVCAEDFLGESSTIDLLAIGSAGELVSIRIGHDEEDQVLLTRALSDLTWLRNHGPDLLKLAPGLGIEVFSEPRAMLFCPQISSETLSAIDNFPAGTIELSTYRCLRQQGQLSLMINAHGTRNAARSSNRSDSSVFVGEPRAEAILPARGNGADSRLTDAPSRSAFRTGLTDADLRREPVGHEITG